MAKEKRVVLSESQVDSEGKKGKKPHTMLAFLLLLSGWSETRSRRSLTCSLIDPGVIGGNGKSVSILERSISRTLPWCGDLGEKKKLIIPTCRWCYLPVLAAIFIRCLSGWTRDSGFWVMYGWERGEEGMRMTFHPVWSWCIKLKRMLHQAASCSASLHPSLLLLLNARTDPPQWCRQTFWFDALLVFTATISNLMMRQKERKVHLDYLMMSEWVRDCCHHPTCSFRSLPTPLWYQKRLACLCHTRGNQMDGKQISPYTMTSITFYLLLCDTWCDAHHDKAQHRRKKWNIPLTSGSCFRWLIRFSPVRAAAAAAMCNEFLLLLPSNRSACCSCRILSCILHAETCSEMHTLLHKEIILIPCQWWAPQVITLWFTEHNRSGKEKSCMHVKIWETLADRLGGGRKKQNQSSEKWCNSSAMGLRYGLDCLSSGENDVVVLVAQSIRALNLHEQHYGIMTAGIWRHVCASCKTTNAPGESVWICWPDEWSNIE